MGWPRTEADALTVALLVVVAVLILALMWVVAGWFRDAADDDEPGEG